VDRGASAGLRHCRACSCFGLHLNVKFHHTTHHFTHTTPHHTTTRHHHRAQQVAAGKRTQAELEDRILALLSSASGSLLDNMALIDTLDASKTTWEEVNASLAVAEATARKLEAAAAAYRPCSVRAAALHFVLNDLASIDPMYQFSLDAYAQLFALSLKGSPRPEALPDRIKALNDHHTYAVYRYAARALFERHKLLLALHMAVRIMALEGRVNPDEWGFFLRGGQVRALLFDLGWGSGGVGLLVGMCTDACKHIRCTRLSLSPPLMRHHHRPHLPPNNPHPDPGPHPAAPQPRRPLDQRGGLVQRLHPRHPARVQGPRQQL